MSQTKEKKYKQKKKLKSFVWFHIDNNIDKYCSGGEGGRKKKKKSKRIYRASQKRKPIYVYLESLMSESFSSPGSQTASPPSDTLRRRADLWTRWRGPSHSTLVQLVCVLASNIHSSHSWCISFCCCCCCWLVGRFHGGVSQWLIYIFIDAESS